MFVGVAPKSIRVWPFRCVEKIEISLDLHPQTLSTLSIAGSRGQTRRCTQVDRDVIFGFREISMDMAWKKSHFDMEKSTVQDLGM